MTQTTFALLFAATLGSGFGLSGSAAAQSAAPAEKPVTIKLGVFLPSGTRLKNAVSDTFFSAGAEYALAPGAGAAASLSGVRPLAYIDYAVANRHGVNASYVGIGPGVRYSLAAPGEGTLTPYVGAGAGAYFLHGSGLGSSANKTQFGYRLNAGVELNQAYLFEISYTDANKLGSTRFSGFNLQVGAKF